MKHFNRSITFSLAFAAWLASLSACAQKKTYLQVQGFEPYVQKFEQKSVEYNQPTQVTDLIIQFGPMDNPRERGVCEITPGETPKISIDEAAWAKMDEGAREALVLHEMGHCVLYRKHKNDYTQDGVPVSLMVPYTMDGLTYDYNEKHYWQELFSSRNEIKE